MALVEMVMPKMGESVMEGTILKWLKKEGDKIQQDESVLEVATDKVDTEVPATYAGVLKQILVKEGQVVQVGSPIAVIDTEADVKVASSNSASGKNEVEKTIVQKNTTSTTIKQEVLKQETKTTTSNRFYSPLVLSIAKQEGISMQELDQVPGTGVEGRVTKKDILAYLEQRTTSDVKKVAHVQTNNTKNEYVSTPAVSVTGNVEIVEMDRMRKVIAQRMVESKRISAHVTSFVEADMTNVVLWRNKIKDEFKKKEGQNITFTPLFMEAVVKALKDFPMVNASVDGDRIIIKKDINIGMAVALPSGNLIVPVIKRADQLNLVGLTKQVNDLAERARLNKLGPDDLTDGTYTISNVGSFGNLMGTPIILQPQVAILATGAIKKKPAVIETEQGDLIGIRHMMFLSHSYDHRIIDGALGGMFVRRVADYLEGFDVDRKI